MIERSQLDPVGSHLEEQTRVTDLNFGYAHMSRSETLLYLMMSLLSFPSMYKVRKLRIPYVINTASRRTHLRIV